MNIQKELLQVTLFWSHMRPDLRLLSLLWQKLAAAPPKLYQRSVTVVAVILHALGVGAKIMQERFRMFRRAGRNFYARDKVTGRSESLGTSDQSTAVQLLAARNQAVAQPQLNRTMAKAYRHNPSPATTSGTNYEDAD